MNEDTINDLKQFISATVSQQTAEIRQDLDRLDKKIDSRIDEVLSAVGDAMENRVQPIEEDVEQLNTRVTKLESA